KGFNTKRARCTLNLRAARETAGVRQHGDSTRLGRELMQQLMSLNIQFAAHNADAGGIAPWSRHAACEAGTHHVVGHPNNRDGGSHALYRLERRIAESDD